MWSTLVNIHPLSSQQIYFMPLYFSPRNQGFKGARVFWDLASPSCVTLSFFDSCTSFVPMPGCLYMKIWHFVFFFLYLGPTFLWLMALLLCFGENFVCRRKVWVLFMDPPQFELYKYLTFMHKTTLLYAGNLRSIIAPNSISQVL